MIMITRNARNDFHACSGGDRIMASGKALITGDPD